MRPAQSFFQRLLQLANDRNELEEEYESEEERDAKVTRHGANGCPYQSPFLTKKYAAECLASHPIVIASRDSSRDAQISVSLPQSRAFR